ncbi:MFS transporter [Krasilnikoviella flava]|uniref:MFS transporter, NNP family, nitrate/nitrite transporter n=1 Tax=Krasilnikoviella flava TaxID=526729 RepID=A0A1T5I6Y9_9MICO|nr:MFS transporter [Krasilnikoviella flava]SKC34954.1 MFS transporter, NNP family, nitrate/nitrite transporter [Krasilnikoviella flava]
MTSAATPGPTDAPTAPAMQGNTTQLALATVGFAICFWAWALLGPLGNSYGQLYHLSDFEVSVLVAVPVIVGSLGRIPIGALTDRFGAKVMFPLCAALTIVPVLFIGFVANSLPWLLIGGFFLGLGGTTFAIGVPFVNNWYPPARRGTAIGIFGAGMGGTAIASFSTVPIRDAWGDGAPFIIVAVFLAVFALASRALLQDSPAWSPGTGGEGMWARTWATLKIPATLQLSWLYAIGFGGFVAFSVYLPTFLQNAYDLSASDASFRTAGFVVLAVVCRPLGGTLSDKVGGVPVSIACFAVVTVFAAVIVFQPALIPGATIAFLGMAAALGASSGATFALVAKMAPPGTVGAVTGVVGAAGGLGGFIPPLIMGAVYGARGDYGIGFGLLALTALLTLLFTLGPVRKRVRANAG